MPHVYRHLHYTPAPWDRVNSHHARSKTIILMKSCPRIEDGGLKKCNKSAFWHCSMSKWRFYVALVSSLVKNIMSSTMSKYFYLKGIDYVTLYKTLDETSMRNDSTLRRKDVQNIMHFGNFKVNWSHNLVGHIRWHVNAKVCFRDTFAMYRFYRYIPLN